MYALSDDHQQTVFKVIAKDTWINSDLSTVKFPTTEMNLCEDKSADILNKLVDMGG